MTQVRPNPSNFCSNCGSQMFDGGAVGWYCPNDACPGIEQNRRWAREQVEASREREAISLLLERGYIVEKRGVGVAAGHVCTRWGLLCLECGKERASDVFPGPPADAYKA